MKKQTLKFILFFIMIAMLTACMMSGEDRMKDKRMKCEMKGLLPGTEPFGKCVKKQ